MSYEGDLSATYSDVRRRLFNGPTPPPKPARQRRVSPFHPSRADRLVWLFGGKPIVECGPDWTPLPTIIPEPPWRLIAREVAAKHGVPMSDMWSSRRNVEAVAARHEAFWRCKNETTMSLPQIGRRFGGRDHTTVLHGIKKHQAKLEAMEHPL